MENELRHQLIEDSRIFEEQLIGCIINGGDFSVAWGIAQPDHFGTPENEYVWYNMGQLYQQGKKVNKHNLRELLKGHEMFRDAGTLDYHISGSELGFPVFTKQTAFSLVNLNSRLALCELALKILEDIPKSNAECPTEKIIHDSRDRLETLKSESGLVMLSGIDVADKMLDLIANPPPLTKTGLDGYDKVLGGGLIPGEAYALTGVNKAGKTMMAGTISYALNKQSVKHGYLCLEMGSTQIMQRQFAMEMQLPLSVFKDEKTRGSNYLADKMIEFKGALIKDNNQIYIDCPLLRVSDAKAALYRLKMEGCQGVIIDYFSLISPDMGFRGNGNEHQDTMAQELTKTAKDIGIWLLILAQQNQDGSTYGSKALLRSSTHIAALEKCSEGETDYGNRWLRTLGAREVMSMNIGNETTAAFKIHTNGSHLVELEQLKQEILDGI